MGGTHKRRTTQIDRLQQNHLQDIVAPTKCGALTISRISPALAVDRKVSNTSTIDKEAIDVERFATLPRTELDTASVRAHDLYDGVQLQQNQ